MGSFALRGRDLCPQYWNTGVQKCFCSRGSTLNSTEGAWESVLPQITIIAITFYCHNLWKSKLMALEKSGKLGIFFLLLCSHSEKDNLEFTRWQHGLAIPPLVLYQLFLSSLSSFFY